ncbi:MAG TPA: Asp-tRNA(Asn)/Glu-tRNA(Gln) amidotransferase subunit GatC [Vicinamibacteria bacterium]|nr:Asp-tRNA(Asn)/Glu-tRNA(Gln) amidotransferase subunit GatC [Vicinamibacteria bacterium]
MARVTPETVARVATLARLSLTEDERRLFTRQLDEVLAYAESLAALDAEAVEEAALPPAGESLREDEPRAGIEAERAIEAAPDAADGLFRVPRVLPG